MTHLKRSAYRYGQALGHRRGFAGEQLLSYVEARWLISLPAYLWVLEHCLQDLLEELRQRATTTPLVFLDYDTNRDILDISQPLSHAELVKLYLENAWPRRDQV